MDSWLLQLKRQCHFFCLAQYLLPTSAAIQIGFSSLIKVDMIVGIITDLQSVIQKNFMETKKLL
jgi:hypothetical protein